MAGQPLQMGMKRGVGRHDALYWRSPDRGAWAIPDRAAALRMA